MASTVGNRPALYLDRAKQARERAGRATKEIERLHFLSDADLWNRMAAYELEHPTHDFSSDYSVPNPRA